MHTLKISTILAIGKTVAGGIPANVLYSGSAPGIVEGVVQVNAVVPAGVKAGNAQVQVTVGGVTSPAGVTVAVK